MATECHTIYSRYGPLEPKALEHEIEQLTETNPNFAWESTAYFGLSSNRPPPYFIPATKLPNEPGNERSDNDFLRNTNEEVSSMGNNISMWYRSLISKEEAKPVAKTAGCSREPDTLGEASSRTGEKKNKNNWFIIKALQSEEAPQSSPSPSLADIITRDPPPMPTEGRYRPPVWLEIGPSNKGFKMLQRSGWSEGEPLGPDVLRRPQYLLSQGQMIELNTDCNEKKGGESLVKHEVLELKLKGHEDIRELREVDVVDLTLSDSDSEEEGSSNPISDTPKSIVTELTPYSESPSTLDHTNNGRTTLLTPIATVLKSDRLGIGLKVKTVGPFRASQKRVTHNAAALAAHLKAAEESQTRKQLLGRGKTGFAKRRKAEELERKRLLAYLND